MTKFECSRCGFTVDDTDIDFENRKSRHVEGRHTEHKVISERDGKPVYNHGMGNIDIGEIKWIRVWT